MGGIAGPGEDQADGQDKRHPRGSRGWTRLRPARRSEGHHGQPVNEEVALNGTVPSYPQYLAGAAAACRVAGVTGMHNHPQVRLPPGDYRDDAMLTTAANNALTSNATVLPGIEATARDGNLELIGTVRYWSQRTTPVRVLAPRPEAGSRERRRDSKLSR